MLLITRERTIAIRPEEERPYEIRGAALVFESAKSALSARQVHKFVVTYPVLEAITGLNAVQTITVKPALPDETIDRLAFRFTTTDIRSRVGNLVIYADSVDDLPVDFGSRHKTGRAELVKDDSSPRMVLLGYKRLS